MSFFGKIVPPFGTKVTNLRSEKRHVFRLLLLFLAFAFVFCVDAVDRLHFFGGLAPVNNHYTTFFGKCKEVRRYFKKYLRLGLLDGRIIRGAGGENVMWRGIAVDWNCGFLAVLIFSAGSPPLAIIGVPSWFSFTRHTAGSPRGRLSGDFVSFPLSVTRGHYLIQILIYRRV